MNIFLFSFILDGSYLYLTSIGSSFTNRFHFASVYDELRFPFTCRLIIHHLKQNSSSFIKLISAVLINPRGNSQLNKKHRKLLLNQKKLGLIAYQWEGERGLLEKSGTIHKMEE